jgi:hypothetical protein
VKVVSAVTENNVRSRDQNVARGNRGALATGPFFIFSRTISVFHKYQ